ncbi:MAG: aminoglycoside phosphotransferase family protein [Patescibacteria group bacterium]|nr:aminoglycoside phosphotransferase family protein [Patescibacteria group bacterium]
MVRKKNMHSLDDESLIGRGTTSEIYAWGKNKVLKLFNTNYSSEAANYEARIVSIINKEKINAPKYYEKTIINGRTGLVYERIYGTILFMVITKFPFDVIKHAKRMAREQFQINSVANNDLPTQKDRLTYLINRSEEILGKYHKKILEKLYNLEGGKNICHGDFHVGNILVQNDKYFIIDWMNAYSGNIVSDAVRTYMMIISPFFPVELNFLKKLLVRTLKRLTGYFYKKEYLKISGKREQEFAEWFPVVAGARLDDDVPGEKEWLLKYIKKTFK